MKYEVVFLPAGVELPVKTAAFGDEDQAKRACQAINEGTLPMSNWVVSQAGFNKFGPFKIWYLNPIEEANELGDVCP